MKIFQSLLVVLIAISLSACTVRNAPTPLSCAIAGAGIVSGSVPEAEWEETGIKFEPVLRALEANGVAP